MVKMVYREKKSKREKLMVWKKEGKLLGFPLDWMRRHECNAAQVEELAFAKCPQSFEFKRIFVLRCFMSAFCLFVCFYFVFVFLFFLI